MKFSPYLFKLLQVFTVAIVLSLGACASITSGNVAPSYFIAFEALKDTNISEIEISSFWGAQKIKLKTSEELSKITGGATLPPGFKFPF